MKRSALMNQQQTFFKYLRWLAVDCFSLNSQYGIGLDYADDSIQVIEFRETLIPIQITFLCIIDVVGSNPSALLQFVSMAGDQVEAYDSVTLWSLSLCASAKCPFTLPLRQ